jgi:hypothetical protein
LNSSSMTLLILISFWDYLLSRFLVGHYTTKLKKNANLRVGVFHLLVRYFQFRPAREQ